MLAKTMRRIAFGGAGLYFLLGAAQAYRQAGFTLDVAFPAAIGALFGVMAVWGKSG